MFIVVCGYLKTQTVNNDTTCTKNCLGQTHIKIRNSILQKSAMRWLRWFIMNARSIHCVTFLCETEQINQGIDRLVLEVISCFKHFSLLFLNIQIFMIKRKTTSHENCSHLIASHCTKKNRYCIHFPTFLYHVMIFCKLIRASMHGWRSKII